MQAKLPKESGIYMITNILNKKRYIGSAKNIKNRKNVHACLLRSGKHSNPHLQASWKKYGEENFIWSVLEICDYNNEVLKQKEKHYFDLINPEYNIVKDPIRHTFSESAKEKAKEANSREYTLRSPEGETIKIKNLKDFCRKNGLVYRYMSAAIRGRQKYHNGWSGIANHKNYIPYQPVTKRTYKFMKNGVIYETNNLRDFAKKHLISHASLGKIIWFNQKLKGFTYVK
jgi:group I intron endonuclease